MLRCIVGQRTPEINTDEILFEYFGEVSSDLALKLLYFFWNVHELNLGRLPKVINRNLVQPSASPKQCNFPEDKPTSYPYSSTQAA